MMSEERRTDIVQKIKQVWIYRCSSSRSQSVADLELLTIEFRHAAVTDAAHMVAQAARSEGPDVVKYYADRCEAIRNASKSGSRPRGSTVYFDAFHNREFTIRAQRNFSDTGEWYGMRIDGATLRSEVVKALAVIVEAIAPSDAVRKLGAVHARYAGESYAWVAESETGELAAILQPRHYPSDARHCARAAVTCTHGAYNRHDPHGCKPIY
jgi:hypothetical protein